MANISPPHHFRCFWCHRMGKRYYAVHPELPFIPICGRLSCQLKAWLSRWRQMGVWWPPWDPWGDLEKKEEN